ncbi:MAG TPA: hypothetical protein VH309_01685 [Elusimicrobiota bacterium]|jgi:hypothetical protein|nr:hypothetical protein [Elusimicrobiota bacterium]
MFRSRTPKLFVKYKNLSGKSTVAKFEVKKDGITVRFTDHSVYRYTNQSADPANISKMKTLALAGKGLGTFIDANVKDRYQRKVK